MIYALDTNTIIHFSSNNENVLRNFSEAVRHNCRIIVPKIVDYEITRGFRILPKPKKESIYRTLMENCIIAEMDASAWEQAIQIYANLYCKRFTVGEMDILIAAICLAHDFTLVTNNTNDFKNIDGLKIFDWTHPHQWFFANG